MVFHISRFAFILVIALSFVSTAKAWVDIKNANFSLTRTDFQSDELGPDLVLERVYNSRANHRGLFGYGWCSNLESKVTLVSKGLAVYQYCGVGRAKVFKSVGYTSKDDDAALEALLKLVRESKSASAKMPATFKTAVKNDIELRATLARNYQFELHANEGEKFAVANFPDSSGVEFSKNQFLMRDENGKLTRFDSEGNLIQVSDRMGRALSLTWKGSCPQVLTGSNKNRVVFTCDSQGDLTSACGPSGKKVSYQFSKDGDLVGVEGRSEPEAFEYDGDHNLTRFKSAALEVKVKYDAQNDHVLEVIAPDCTRKYKYDVNREEKKLAVSVDSRCESKPKETVKYDFDFSESASGALYESSMTAQDSEGRRTSIQYGSENKPTRFEHGKKITELKYDERGRLKETKIDSKKTAFLYDDQGRLASVKFSSAQGQSREIRYEYDAKGVLRSAHLGSAVIHYDRDSMGRLAVVANEAGQRVEIGYRSPASTRPSTISSTKDGKIDLIYNETTGQVSPPKGDEALRKFVSIYSTYEDLIGPAAEALKRSEGP